jgi:hypothetical protein
VLITIDDKVNPEVLDALERKLRRYTLESKLELCRKISHFVDPLMPKKEALNYMFVDGMPPDTWFKNGRYQLFEIEYLSLVSTVCGEWKGPLNSLVNKNEYRNIINLYRQFVPPFVHIIDNQLLEMEKWKAKTLE